ncbi:NAD(P)/FAD-dependent oxidoreductase [Albibacillus kandeliae]|uniref:NAD(P)/FAD-dependent oxidoreductase n=1 Tax=Albibacillus kandeliae TaxID=2174228 RepID=UPI000D697CA2|nr:FAD-binding oxidoreductase [Albibacillus kandeliae]
MKHIFSEYAYGPGPRDGCWWDETIAAPEWPRLQGNLEADVAIIGGGFTGVSAALHLAEAGVSVALLEAKFPGFGASGRNGGFCCLGGAMIKEPGLTRRVGAEAAAEYWQAEEDAVNFAASVIERLGLDVDRHSRGETQLAHRPKDMEKLRRKAEAAAKSGTEVELIEAGDLAAKGLGGPFHGALTFPVGFGLNPRKYLFGMATAADQAGARLYRESPVTALKRGARGWELTTPHGTVTAETVIVGTNGYSSEDLPKWLGARYIPAQSNVLVTRPLTDAELDAQGWTSDQASYDTRNLLHYFRLMPDRRFLFGMRGGLMSSPAAEAKARQRNRADFEAMFPAWKQVEATHAWSGMVCLARLRTPFVGSVPGQPGLFAGMAYHGNGVAMGSYSGMMLAELAQGRSRVPRVMQTPLARFPLGPFRRILLPPFYLARALADL